MGDEREGNEELHEATERGGVMGVWEEEPKPYLRLRQVGKKWSIVRVRVWQQYGREVVAEGLTRKQAEQYMKLLKEE